MKLCSCSGTLLEFLLVFSLSYKKDNYCETFSLTKEKAGSLVIGRTGDMELFGLCRNGNIRSVKPWNGLGISLFAAKG